MKKLPFIINARKGFTILELMVVVVIVAVLTAIVLSNISQYVNRGKNSSIKGNLTSVFTNSAVYFDANANYNVFCNTSYVLTAQASIAKSNGGAAGTWNCTCDTAACAAAPIATKFCAAAMETPVGATGTVFCVDYTGVKKEVNSTTPAAECLAGVCQ